MRLFEPVISNRDFTTARSKQSKQERINWMYFLKYETLPKPNVPRLKNFGATLALCWIDEPTKLEADGRARNSITKEGWNILSLEEAYEVRLEDYNPDHPAYSSFQLAQEKGERIIFVAVPSKPTQ